MTQEEIITRINHFLVEEFEVDAEKINPAIAAIDPIKVKVCAQSISNLLYILLILIYIILPR